MEEPKQQQREWSFATRALHGPNRAPQPDFTAVSTPIYPSAWFIYEDVAEMDAVFGGERPGFVYGRYGNPTVVELEETIARLEGAEGSVAFASGMAAVHAALMCGNLSAGDRIVASRDIYGATYFLLANVFPRFGIETTFFDPTDRDGMEQNLAQGGVTTLIAETISNPLMKVADVRALAEMAHRHGARLILDNTFPTPYLLRPLELGADLVLHSATKYLGGHGDVTGGVVAGSASNVAQLKETAKLVGGILSPFEAWLIMRGIRTLSVRVERQCHNAERVARWLTQSPRVAKVNYPGLESHPQHDLAARMLEHGLFGAMISFEIEGAGHDEILRFLTALKLCLPATSLGDVYTLVLYPAMSSHRALTPEERAAFGIRDNLVRISVGLEDPEDVIADLEQALEACAPASR
jgi:cystathionine beta-lyase/cystathionine gamma-synthase